MRDEEQVRLRLLPTTAATHDVKTTPEGRWRVRELEQVVQNDLAEWLPGDAADEAAARDKLRLACAERRCVVRAASTLIRHQAKLWALLTSWKRVTEGLPQLELSFVPRTRDGATVVSGRLTPEVIQSVVRQHFDLFRKCYEQGLERNDELMGRVTARFVIERDGNVLLVADGGSDIPDAAVRECVLLAFRNLPFPAPPGDVVKVVYPIMFAPE